MASYHISKSDYETDSKSLPFVLEKFSLHIKTHSCLFKYQKMRISRNFKCFTCLTNNSTNRKLFAMQNIDFYFNWWS